MRIRGRIAWALYLGCGALAAASVGADEQPGAARTATPTQDEACAWLDDPAKRGILDGALLGLARQCGRKDLLGTPGAGDGEEGGTALHQRTTSTSPNPDVRVSDPTGETGPSTTQSETSMAYSETTGTACSAYNDSWSDVNGLGGLGFSRSTDHGASWSDRGAVAANSLADPALVWSRSADRFFLAGLSGSMELEVWRSDDDCQSWTSIAVPSGQFSDKPMLTVDNNPNSPHYGNLYLVWFHLSVGSIRSLVSTNDGLSWGNLLSLSPTNGQVQGAWPAVAPDGTLVVAWIQSPSLNAGADFAIQVARSTDGGQTFGAGTSPVANATPPYDPAALAACGRPALNGNVRVLPFPQLTYSPQGRLHLVYAADPDGASNGDTSNIYHRFSDDHGTTWGPITRLNTDATLNDQWGPTLQLRGATVVASWYDRRLDPGNLLFDHFAVTSTDGGITWGANERLTDRSTKPRFDPAQAACYHGDYDQSIVTAQGAIVQWSANRRRGFAQRPDPDVWSETQPVAKRGATWSLIAHDPILGTDHVGCTGCDLYNGDRSCGEIRPLLCLNPSGLPNPGIPTNTANAWTGALFGLSAPIRGTLIESQAAADQLCASSLGAGFRLATSLDAGGAPNGYGYGNVSGNDRFWIASQHRRGNCWAGDDPLPPP